MKGRSILFAVCATLFSTAPLRPAAAATLGWAVNGNPICIATGTQVNIDVVSDGAGGAFAAWNDFRTTDRNVYVQRVTGDGDIAPGWPVDGRLPTVLPRRRAAPHLLADGNGGVFVAWHDQPLGSGRFDVYVQRLTASGTIAPGWPDDGVLVALVMSNQASVTMVPDGADGFLLTWHTLVDTTRRIYAQRIGPTGAVAAGWPAGGLAVCSTGGHQRLPRSVTDGDGGLIVTWQDGRGQSSDIYAQRLRGDGTRATGWPVDGAPLCTAAGEQVHDSYECIVPDGLGGALVTWEDRRGPNSDIYAQHILASGSVAPMWPPDGAAVCTATGDQTQPVLASNSVGGAFPAWKDERGTTSDIYAADILADGTLETGWPANGLGVCTAGGGQDQPVISEDGTGAAYIAWTDGRNASFDVYASRVLSSGTPAPGWGLNGNNVCTAAADQNQVRAIGDGVGGLIVTWSDFRTTNITGPDIYGIRVPPDYVTPVLVSLASVVAEPSRVRLRWYGDLTSAAHLAVERADVDGDWLEIGPPRLVDDGYLTIEDTDVRPGLTYGYRLTWTEHGVVEYSEESWVQVPALPASELSVLSPQLSAGIVEFTLPNGDPATLEVFDASGRREWRREVGALGAGRHQLSLDRAEPFRAGVHLVRLTQDTATAKCKAVVLR